MGLRIDDKLVVYANLSNLSVLPQDPWYVQLVVTLEFQPAIVYLGEIIQSKTLLRC